MSAAALSAADMRAAPNEATRMAQQDTMLTPALLHHRFRGTRQDRRHAGARRMGRADRRDEERPQQGPFHRNDRVEASSWRRSPEPLRKEFIDFLVSSLTAEFSGCVLYKEMKQARQQPRHLRAVQLHEPRRGPPCRLHQRRAEGIRHRRQSGLPDQGQEVHLLPAEIHLLRDLSVGEDRLCPLHHDLPPSGRAPGPALPPDLQMVPRVVQ